MMYVRLASRGGALLVAAFTCLAFIHPFAAPMRENFASAAGAVSIVVEQSVLAPPAARPPTARHMRAVAPNLTALSAPKEAQSGDASSHMWLDNSAGRVHFANEREYLRCLDSAITHIPAEGCPPPPPGKPITDHPPQSHPGFILRAPPLSQRTR
jgi:hypothetical protein